MDKSTPPPEEKGKAKEETVNSSQPGQDPKMSLEMLNAIWEAAREKAARNFLPAVDNGVPASVAIPALLAMEEEGLRESLFEDDLDEEERARILSHLEGIENQRRWLNFQRTLAQQTALVHATQTSSKAESQKGKGTVD